MLELTASFGLTSQLAEDLCNAATERGPARGLGVQPLLETCSHVREASLLAKQEQDLGLEGRGGVGALHAVADGQRLAREPFSLREAPRDAGSRRPPHRRPPEVERLPEMGCQASVRRELAIE